MTPTVTRIGPPKRRLPLIDFSGVAPEAWPKNSLIAACGHYATEWFPQECPQGDLNRTLGALWNAMEFFGPAKEIETFTRADGRHYARARLGQGVKEATVKRELGILSAACNHEHREDRIKARIKFHVPKGSEPRVRWLSREEHRRLMLTPMPGRLRKFYILAFGTGARAEAIEELTWDRVDLVARTIDYRVAGIRYKNKRRVVVPISDELLPRLQSMYDSRKDDYVIGLGPSGRVTSTYHQAVAAMALAGIEDAVPRHVCRHTFVSWLLQAGASIYEVAQLVGDTVAMLEKTYGHMMPKHLLAAVNRMH